MTFNGLLATTERDRHQASCSSPSTTPSTTSGSSRRTSTSQPRSLTRLV